MNLIVKWYKDRATEMYLSHHDVSDPSKMTPHELADTLTYIEEDAYSSPYARELCRRAGNLEKWLDYRLRRNAVKRAAASFGSQIV